MQSLNPIHRGVIDLPGAEFLQPFVVDIAIAVPRDLLEAPVFQAKLQHRYRLFK